jgi:hypothetical protein
MLTMLPSLLSLALLAAEPGTPVAHKTGTSRTRDG